MLIQKFVPYFVSNPCTVYVRGRYKVDKVFYAKN